MQYHLCAASHRGVLEMFDLVHMYDKTLSRGEYIETKDFNLLASSGLAKKAGLLPSCIHPPCNSPVKRRQVAASDAF